MISQNTKMTIGHLISKYLLTFVRFLLLWVLANCTVSQMIPDRKLGSFAVGHHLKEATHNSSQPTKSSGPCRQIAAHYEKSFLPAFFKVSIDVLFDNLESGKKLLFWKKDWPKSSKILDPKIYTNPALTLLVPKVTNINFLLATSADHQE